MLLFPDVRQKHEHDCAAALFDGVCRFYGRFPAQYAPAVANQVQGCSPDTLESVLRGSNFSVLSGTMNWGDLKHLTASGRPVLCPITTVEGGHWVAVLGVSRGMVYFHDPALDAHQPNPRKQSIRHWCALWRDTSKTGAEYVNWGICPSEAV